MAEKEYIEREKALSEQNKSMNLAECRKRLERIPAADVRPVVRGEWEPTGIPNRPFPKWFQCSNCKTIFGAGITGAIAPEYGNRTWNYCPMCGMKTKGEIT